MNTASAYLDPDHTSRLVAVAVLAVAGAAFFWHPLALLLSVCLFAVVVPTVHLKWLFLVAAVALFAILNVSREVDGDLITYVSIQEYLGARPFYTLFDKQELQLISGTYRLTEMGFYAPAWLISQVLRDSKTSLAMTATLGIYIPTFLGLTLIGETEKWNKGLVLTVALFTLFAGVNFIQSTHLIRQYMSSAMLFMAFALFIAERRGWAVVFALYACTIHNGTALLIPLVMVVCWMFRNREGKRFGPLGLLIRIVAMFGFLALTTVAVPILAGELSGNEVPNIHVGHYAIVGAFFVTAHIAIEIQHIRLKSLLYARLAFVAIYTLSLGFYILGLQLYALRYFAYLEWLYGLMLGSIIFTLFRDHRGMRVFARFTVSLVAVAILVARISASEWMYGPGNNYLLSWDYFQVTQLVSR
jgi:hypothetical protein